MLPNAYGSYDYNTGYLCQNAESILLLIQYVWIDQLVVIGVSSNFKALVTTIFVIKFFFNTSNYVYPKGTTYFTLQTY